MMEWINIQETLPEKLGSFLCYVKREIADDEIHVGRYYENGVWVIGRNFCFDIGEVTHWMPLPKPPKT